MTAFNLLPESLSIFYLERMHFFFHLSFFKHLFEDIFAGSLIHIENLLRDNVLNLGRRHVVDHRPRRQCHGCLLLLHPNVWVFAHRGPSPSHSKLLKSVGLSLLKMREVFLRLSWQLLLRLILNLKRSLYNILLTISRSTRLDCNLCACSCLLIVTVVSSY